MSLCFKRWRFKRWLCHRNFFNAVSLLVIRLIKDDLSYSKTLLHIFRYCRVYFKSTIFESTVFKKGRLDRNLSVNISTTRYNRNQGFTLVELMITVSVLAIILTIAAPAIQTQLASMEAKRIYSQIGSTLSLAKAESYIRKENVLVCLSDAEGRCHRDGKKTLLAFIDKSGTNNYDAQADVLITQQSLNLKYSRLNLRVGNRRHYTKFWGDSGTPRGHFGHIKYCPTVDYNKAIYLVSFNQAGIVKQKLNANHPTECDDS